MSLVGVIEEARDALEMRARRLFAVESAVAALTRDSRGKRFTIHNDIVWLMMLDCRDKLVIDLADWAKAAYAPGLGGFFRTIQSSHIVAFGARRTWGEEDDVTSDDDDRAHAEARSRLWPGAGAKLTQDNVQDLINEFTVRFRPLADDRHHNRAHEYEHERRGTAKAKMLDMSEVRDLIEYAHRILVDLSMASIGRCFHLSDRNAADSAAVADELSELILIPAVGRAKLQRADLPKSRLFADLHDHDTSPPPAPDDDDAVPPRPTFNDLGATWRSLDRLESA